jgi:hypothetical protein
VTSNDNPDAAAVPAVAAALPSGVRSRSELVGQIFLEHYVPRWEDMADAPTGWVAKAAATDASPA